MRVGIVDLGSNSIRLVIFETEKKRLNRIINVKHQAKSVLYIKENKMSLDGVTAIIGSLKELVFIADVYKLDAFRIFATASLRNIGNSKETIQAIESVISRRIDLLSDADEALLGFESLMQNNENENEACLIDIGGGSMEITHFKDDHVFNTTSIPYGSLSFYSKHVHNIIPNAREQKEMRTFINDQFKKVTWLNDVNVKSIIGIGGSSRALLKVCKHIDCQGTSKKDRTLDAQVIGQLSMLDDSHSKSIISAVPDRLTTMIPGAIMVDELMKLVSAQEFIVSSASVREGYIYRNMIK